MNPTIILVALSLSGPLDHVDYRVRERAKIALASLPQAYSWPAVRALSKSKSPEVSQAAERLLARWASDGLQAKMLEIKAAAEYAMTQPVGKKPWRRLANITCHDDAILSDFIYITAQDILETARPGIGIYWSMFDSLERDQVFSHCCTNNWLKELAECIWTIRLGKMGLYGTLEKPDTEDW